MTRVTVALGILTIPQNRHLRLVARDTWMQQLPERLVTRFILREPMRPTHEVGDVLYVNVSGNAPQERHGRMIALLAWFAHASRRFDPMWIAKLDDDTYLRPRAYERLLRVIGEHDATYVGNMVWHAYDSDAFEPRAFAYGYVPESRCRSPCVSPFPFAAGWAIALTGPIARAVASHPDVQRDVERAATLRGRQILEDVWLGSVVHRFFNGTRIVHLAHHYWTLGTSRRSQKGREGPYPTAVMWHQKNTSDSHERLRGRRRVHPELVCPPREHRFDEYLKHSNRHATYCRLDDRHMRGRRPPASDDA